MKAYRGIRGIAPRILNLGSSWRRAVNFTALPRKNHGTLQSAAEWTPRVISGEEKILLPLPEFEAQTIQTVA
jgi:hypothetical protein